MIYRRVFDNFFPLSPCAQKFDFEGNSLQLLLPRRLAFFYCYNKTIKLIFIGHGDGYLHRHSITGGNLFLFHLLRRQSLLILFTN